MNSEKKKHSVHKRQVMPVSAELMVSFSGTRINLQALKRFSAEYNLSNKRLSEFNELDKMVYQNIKQFVKMI